MIARINDGVANYLIRVRHWIDAMKVVLHFDGYRFGHLYERPVRRFIPLVDDLTQFDPIEVVLQYHKPQEQGA